MKTQNIGKSMRDPREVILLQNKLLNSILPSYYWNLKTLSTMTEKSFLCTLGKHIQCHSKQHNTISEHKYKSLSNKMPILQSPVTYSLNCQHLGIRVAFLASWGNVWNYCTKNSVFCYRFSETSLCSINHICLSCIMRYCLKLLYQNSAFCYRFGENSLGSIYNIEQLSLHSDWNFTLWISSSDRLKKLQASLLLQGRLCL